MKKTNLLLVLILLLTLALSACQGSSAEEINVEAAGTPEPGTERGLSESMQLLLGILSLADSEYPLTIEQATAMLPLWKAVRSLGESDTAAQAEIDGLYTQIQNVLTAEQQTAIDSMALTTENMASLAETLGLETGFGGRGGNASPEMQATMQALRASGQMPEGGFGGELPEGVEMPERPEGFVPGSGQGMGGGMGGGGEMFGGGAGLTPEQIATAQASGVSLPSLNNTISSVWLNALISTLEGIIAGE